MAKKAVKVESVRIRFEADLKRLFEKAAALSALDLSSFARASMMKEVDRMRAEGKKL